MPGIEVFSDELLLDLRAMPYTPHGHHRNGSFASQKSQWVISLNEEIAAYNNAWTKRWGTHQCFWGLHFTAAGIDVLGVSPAPDAHRLKIAKFVGDDRDNWHGYPVAHWLSPWDKPQEEILKAWKDAGLINGPTFSKIHRGKRCNL